MTASVGRGTFVRSLVPAAAEEQGDDWQAYVLPDRPTTYQEEILSDAFRLPQREGMISLATGFPSPRFTAAPELGEIAAEVFKDEPVNAMSYVMPEGLPELRERLAEHGEARGGTERPGRDHRDLGRPAGDRPGRTHPARARRRGRGRVPHVHRLAALASRHRRAGDRRAGRPGRDRRGRARAGARAPRGEGRARCRPRARTPRASTCRRSAARGSPSWPWTATCSCSRTACTPTCASRASTRPRCGARRPGT